MLPIEVELSKQLVLGEILARNARKFPDREALVMEDRRLSYREFNERVNRLAHALTGIGVKKDDKVALLFLNCIEMMECIYATVKLGAIVVPLNFRLTSPELRYQIDYSDSKVLIFDSSFGQLIEPIRPDLPEVNFYISTGQSAFEGAINYEEFLKGQFTEEPLVMVVDDDPAAILFTSGTTGLPKGVVLTHKNLTLLVNSLFIEFHLPSGLRELVVFPIFHSAGLGLTYASIYSGGTCVLLPLTKLTAENILRTIQDEKIYWGALAPTLWNAVVNEPKRSEFDLSSFRFAACGSAPTPVETKRRIIELFPNLPGISDFFSQTETSTLTIPSDPAIALVNPATVGNRPILPIEARLVDDNDNDVPVGQPGEVVFKGTTVFKEYYKDPEGTAQAFRGGWFHSGDILRQDEDGYYYVVDRKKDIIITGGENVSSVEVEDLIMSHPKVYEVAVIGVPHEKWGETVKAIVQLQPGQTMTEQELIEYCRQKIAHFKCPTSVDFVEQIPRNVQGKVLKYKLREKYGKEVSK